jgi:uncharacterized protein (TIGR02246 family)
MQRFIVFAVFVLALLCAATQVQARTEVCQEVSQSQIAALFDRWNASLKTGDPTKVVANYAPRSILLPTVSNKPRLSVREKENYFVHFLARRPVGRIDSRSIQTGCNWAVDAGLYTFRFADGSEVKARYTYTYRWSGRRWLISSHHSSAMPEVVAAH